MKKLDHVNVLKLIEVIKDEEENSLCMVLEFADGGTVMDGEETQGKEQHYQVDIWKVVF